MSEDNDVAPSAGRLSVDPLRAPVAYVRGVGDRFAEILARLGIVRAFDLLFFFPRDYQEILLKRSVDELIDGELQSIVGTILDSRRRFTRIGIVDTLAVSIQNEIINAVWFNVQYVNKYFSPGRRVMLTGSPKFKSGFWEFSHPTLTFLDKADELLSDLPSSTFDKETKQEDDPRKGELRILPVYRLTEGLSQYRLQTFVKNALKELPDLLLEALPEKLLESRNLATISDAIRKIHFPTTLEEAQYARRRFVYQELLILQLGLAICRTRRRVNMRALVLPRTAKIDSRIRRLFPFDLTEAQQQAIAEISEDMGRPTPMNRLLQGDVGSGKTVVAIYAALQAVANGAQAVLMAPTEVLARQHLRTLREYLRESSTKIVPLFGGQKASERAEILEEIRSGSAQIVVGTQALVYNEIEFQRLGLVIIDEQHKFGVRQRASLKSSADLEPHYLVMTATPIPRSLTMTLFGDLDVSVMKSLPPGRRKTTTTVLTERNRASWWKFVRERLDEGRQAYVVAPRVDDGKGDLELELAFEGRELRKIENDGTFSSDFDFWNNWAGPEKDRVFQKNDGENCETEGDGEDQMNDASRLKTVWSIYKELSEGELKGYRLGVVHGRMTTIEKEAIMRDFRCGAIQTLIATSVVEVGVDVPNATIMTIENAERFGLAQLHQLRGRVARGKFPGFCAVAPTDQVDADVEKDTVEKGQDKKTTRRMKKTSKGKKSEERKAEERRRNEVNERLEFFASTTDGFELAEKDFVLRGPGELFGARQHGSASLRVADLSRDRDILDEACADARTIVAADPGLAEPEHAALRRQVMVKYGSLLNLGDVG